MAFSTYSKEELLKKLKSQNNIYIVQLVLVLLLVILAVVSTIDIGISITSFLPLFFLPMVFLLRYDIKKIKKELAKRS
ncbi:hypothetical protein [uncultured Polaribacter sp.]|uniref:hypothetical protein n=1 Tax=uncultured Polaribacter sp. TaxID=174711 RepID=UPI00261D3C7B|nr:hypothetical protein [uncultured Polaribacter sp.]